MISYESVAFMQHWTAATIRAFSDVGAQGVIPADCLVMQRRSRRHSWLPQIAGRLFVLRCP